MTPLNQSLLNTTFSWLACLCLAAGAQAAEKETAELNSLSPQDKAAGWKLLFDGKTTTGWRNYRKNTVNPGWQVKDGALTRAGKDAGDIVTQDQYEHFEISIEYRIAKGGNSGLMFHVTEEANSPWMTGPEIQIQDNVDGHDPQKSGWLYQLWKADTDATRPAGEWNHLRVVIGSQKSETWMNGVKYYEFTKGTPEWDARVAKSKFASTAQFGKPKKGHICLQDHGNEVAFRNVKIRELK